MFFVVAGAFSLFLNEINVKKILKWPGNLQLNLGILLKLFSLQCKI